MASTARSLRYALAILTTSLVTPSVWAHAHLTHQYPAANAQVTAAPQAITLNFSEGVETGFSGAKITGPKNENIKTLPAKRNEQDQKQLIVPLADSLKP
ncbi:CopC domain-containing protein YobA, partial [Escherichia coli]